MSLRGILLASASLALLGAADPGIVQVRNVYLMPMGGGLDQYLANRLTRSGRYSVVTDPKQADALLSDQLGAGFEERVRQLYPPPEPPKTETESAPVNSGSSTDKTADKTEKSMVSLMGDASAGGGRFSTFSRGKGNIFLVDRLSGRVVWSTFLRPRSSAPADLNRAADNIVDRLDGDIHDYVKHMRKMESNAGTGKPVMPPASVAAPPPAAVPPPAAAAPAAAPAQPPAAPASAPPKPGTPPPAVK